jgi:hypothetical protein
LVWWGFEVEINGERMLSAGWEEIGKRMRRKGRNGEEVAYRDENNSDACSCGFPIVRGYPGFYYHDVRDGLSGSELRALADARIPPRGSANN